MTKRYFNGGRSGSGGLGEAAKLKKLELQKGGKLLITNADRYKRIMNSKLEEQRKKAAAAPRAIFALAGTKGNDFKMSKKAEAAMQQIAAKKAAKEAKVLRKMVAVQPRSYGGAGRIDSKGKIYDSANNLVMKVDTKNGQIKTMGGWAVGKYKSRSMANAMMIKDNIVKHSPYFIQQRKIEQLQREAQLKAMMEQGTIYNDASGHVAALSFMGGRDTARDAFGNESHSGPRGGGMTAWGAVSNNVWGTFGENAWGTMSDNVWGTASTDVWGGISAPVNWGKRGLTIWGSGGPNQKNYLRPLGAFLSTVLGLHKLNFRIGRGRSGGGSGRR